MYDDYQLRMSEVIWYVTGDSSKRGVNKATAATMAAADSANKADH